MPWGRMRTEPESFFFFGGFCGRNPLNGKESVKRRRLKCVCACVFRLGVAYGVFVYGFR